MMISCWGTEIGAAMLSCEHKLCSWQSKKITRVAKKGGNL